MKTFDFRASAFLPRPRPEVFGFFGDAANLEKITPPWLGFHIVTPGAIEMKPGALIDYEIRLRGIPIRWRTEITAWEPPVRFVDVQVRGPYRLWEHEHAFEEAEGGTIARDHVRYAVPGGALVNRLFVARDLAKIFGYREARLRELLG